MTKGISTFYKESSDEDKWLQIIKNIFVIYTNNESLITNISVEYYKDFSLAYSYPPNKSDKILNDIAYRNIIYSYLVCRIEDFKKIKENAKRNNSRKDNQ